VTKHTFLLLFLAENCFTTIKVVSVGPGLVFRKKSLPTGVQPQLYPRGRTKCYNKSAIITFNSKREIGLTTDVTLIFDGFKDSEGFLIHKTLMLGFLVIFRLQGYRLEPQRCK